MHESGFVRAKARMTVSVPPLWAMEPQASLLEQIDALVMRYLPPLKGVLVAHENGHFAKSLGLIDADGAYASAPAVFNALVWRPQLGMRLAGSITLSSPSHVSLLLYGTFNAAISAPHLPLSEWEFCHYEDEARADERSVGYWRHRRTHERLGGESQTLEFTVISMTIANHMLSLHGSLLPEPFSVPPPRPGSLEFEVAVPEASEPAREPEHEEPAPRRVRWEDSDSEAEEAAQEPAPEPESKKRKNEAEESEKKKAKKAKKAEAEASSASAESAKKARKAEKKAKKADAEASAEAAAKKARKAEKKARKEAGESKREAN